MADEEFTISPEEANAGSAYPMFFGVSCAFLALQFLSAMAGTNAELWKQQFSSGQIMLRGSAQLLGLLFEKAQRRQEALQEEKRMAEVEVMELKQIRAEDAKANEKVVSIFAAREQTWQAERRRLMQQIHSFSRELTLSRSKTEETVADLENKVFEEQQARRVKDNVFEEEAKKRRDLEERLRVAQRAAEEYKERANKESQDNLLELRKQKTAFTELVSKQRQLEAEMARVLRQAEATKQELADVYEQKEEAAAMVEKLSEEFVRIQKDAEQKGKIVSAMLRKAKHDTAEKQALLHELKICKAKKKQVELEAERWRTTCESRQKKCSREMALADAGSSRERVIDLQTNSRLGLRTRLFDYLTADKHRDHEFPQEKMESVIKPVEFQDQFLNEGEENLDNIQELQGWIRLETNKYTIVLEQRHDSEIEAFAEQLRIRDEKLEALHWQLLSAELDSKMLQSHIEGLDGNLTQLRDEYLKLEAMLEDRERELKSLKERFSFYDKHFQVCNSPPYSESRLSQFVYSAMNATKTESKPIEQTIHVVENDIQEDDKTDDAQEMQQPNIASFVVDREPSTSNSEASSNDDISFKDQAGSITMTLESQNEETQEEKEVSFDTVHDHTRNNSLEDAFVFVSTKLASDGQPFMKMDIQALGISFKIKRLRQQLLALENLVGTQSTELSSAKVDINDASNEEKFQLKGLSQVMSLLNKQLRRYESLEEKIDALCRRMLENSRTGTSRHAQDGATKENTEKLQQFLEETFQLQRYMVATGQKLMESHNKINGSLSGVGVIGESAGFNMRQFLDVVTTLFKEVQRGLEVRIARIIGDIEGTLTCEGILRS